MGALNGFAFGFAYLAVFGLLLLGAYEVFAGPSPSASLGPAGPSSPFVQCRRDGRWHEAPTWRAMHDR
jgi:hypothetical protein